MSKFKSIPLEDLPWEAGSPTRRCDNPDCSQDGLHRAPQSPDELESYLWFCLEHVREYNMAWNYFAGMTPEEIELHTRADTVGWRPSWPFGYRMANFHASAWTRVWDTFGIAQETRMWGRKLNGRGYRLERKTPQAKALALFGLTAPPNLGNLKTRYKELVKRYHPDANGGDKKSEERLKLINQAYTLLKSTLYAS